MVEIIDIIEKNIKDLERLIGNIPVEHSQLLRRQLSSLSWAVTLLKRQLAMAKEAL